MDGINLFGIDTTIGVVDDIRKNAPVPAPQMSNFFGNTDQKAVNAGFSAITKPDDFSVDQWTTKTREDSQVKLNDGTYIDKFDNYYAGTNNEERLAQNQSTTDKWLNGLGKLATKTGNVVLGNTAGFAYGIGKAMTEGSLSAIYDNDFVKTVDDWNTKLDYNLPNYYTQQEKDASFGGSLTSANFWANDVLAGTAFTLGTVASEAMWAYATGGASWALKGAKIGAKVGTVARVASEIGTITRVGEEAIAIDKTLTAIERAKNFVKEPFRRLAAKEVNREGAILGAKIGERLNTVRFAATSSGAEAATEAWHYKKEAREKYFNNFEELNGRAPSSEEVTAFEENLANSANAVFALNTAIVGGANVLFLGGNFNIKSPLSSLSAAVDKSLFGIGTEVVEEGGKKVVKALNVTKFNKIASAGFGVGKNLFNEVIFEEGLQGVTSKAADKWIESTYNPKYTAQNLDLMGAVYESMAEEYGTKEGWKELGTAALTTILGGGLTGNLYGEAYTDIKERRKDMVYNAAGLNNFNAETVVGNIMRNRMAMANQMQGAQERQIEAQAKGDAVGGEIARNDSMFARVHFNANIKKDASEDLNDLKLGMDLMTEEQFKEQGISPENIQSFKEDALSEYKTLSDSYSKNRDFAEAMTGRDIKFVGEGGINKRLLVEALTYNLTMGEVTGGLQSRLLEETKKQILGVFTDTSFTAQLDVNNILQNASDKTSKEYYSVNKEITKTNKQKEALEKSLIQLERLKNTKEDNTAYNKKYAYISGKLIELNSSAMELKQRRDTLLQTARIENPFIKNDVSVSPIDLDRTEEQLTNLTTLINNLQETNPVGHAKVTKLIKEYNASVKQLKEFNNAVSELTSKNYKPKLQNSFLSKLSKSGKSLDEYTRDFFLKTIDDYSTLKTKMEYVINKNEEVNSNISAEEFKAFQENNTVSGDILNNIAEKVKNDKTLTSEEQQVYKAKKLEVDEIVNNTEDDIVVDPDALINTKIKELEAERDALNDADNDAVNKEYAQKIEALRPTKSAVETLKNRIKTALKDNYLSMTYVGDSYDDIIDKQPTQAELDEYNEYLSKIKNKSVVNKPADLPINYVKRIGLTNEELKKFQALNFKLSQWRMLDGAVTGEDESMSDLIQMLNQLETKIDQKTTKSIITKQENVDLMQTGEVQAKGTQNQNSFTQVHDTVTAKIVEQGGERIIRFSDLNIQTILKNFSGSKITIVDPQGNRGLVTPQLVNDFAKAEGTKFIIDDVQFNIENKGRISVKENEYNTIKDTLNLVPLSSTLSHSTYIPVYQQVNEEGEMTKVSSDFTPQTINENSIINYNADALYDTEEGEIVRFVVRLDDTYNDKIVREYLNAVERTSDKKELVRLKADLEANLVIFTVKNNGSDITGSLKATNSITATTDENENSLRIRQIAFSDLMNHIESEKKKMGASYNFDNISKTSRVSTTVEAKRIILGIPNMTIVKTEEGFEPSNIDFSPEAVENVVTTGFIQGGVTKLAKDIRGVRFDFITKLSENNPTKKIPIVVFKYRGVQIAYPISLIHTKVPKGNILTEIDAKNLSDVEKVKELNNKLIENGIEPVEFGLTSWNQNNKLDAIFERLNNLEDFIDVDTLIDPEYEKGLLAQQAQISIDLAGTPISAPKLVLNLAKTTENEPLFVTEVVEEVPLDNAITVEIGKLSKQAENLEKQMEELDKKSAEVEKLYKLKMKSLTASKASPATFLKAKSSRDSSLATLDAKYEILDERLIGVQNAIEDLQDLKTTEDFSVTSSDSEAIDELEKEC